ncbi:protein DUF2344 [Candidatus Termititenax persephonae]|uniref:Protein DUF2344 n=1 Tax=Candidatus Termititenax persephonae TaxID=2218525 RepID=A0A388TF51_9BACT|nr:protein DUF2344 [Candidatus Termititenax persephonae]
MSDCPYKYSLTFTKNGLLIFLSQLDLMRLFGRVIQKSSLPVAYTQGFNPHPRYALPYPLPVGYVGEAEILAIYLTQPVPENTLIEEFNRFLPPDIRVRQAVGGALTPRYYLRVVLAGPRDWSLPANWADLTVAKENKKSEVQKYRLGDHVRLEQSGAELRLLPLSDKVFKAEKVCAALGIALEQITEIVRAEAH